MKKMTVQVPRDPREMDRMEELHKISSSLVFLTNYEDPHLLDIAIELSRYEDGVKSYETSTSGFKKSIDGIFSNKESMVSIQSIRELSKIFSQMPDSLLQLVKMSENISNSYSGGSNDDKSK